ncbi:MAG: 6-phosphogluconolactonase [Pseudoxanthomonas sp.]
MSIAANIALHSFADGDTLAAALAQTVADNLRAALNERGTATLALSGGNTPKRFFQALSRQSLDWAKVTVTLVDERWVGEDSERSNAALVRAILLQHEAAAANFLPLYRANTEVEQALPAIETTLAPRLPLDVAVLGMGADGHTASYFPGGDRLTEALDPATPARVLPMRAPGAGEPRITLTLPVLLAARHLYLHIEGAEKRTVLERAVAGDDLPIRAVLQHFQAVLPAYWCP